MIRPFSCGNFDYTITNYLRLSRSALDRLLWNGAVSHYAADHGSGGSYDLTKCTFKDNTRRQRANGKRNRFSLISNIECQIHTFQGIFSILPLIPCSIFSSTPMLTEFLPIFFLQFPYLSYI